METLLRLVKCLKPKEINCIKFFYGKEKQNKKLKLFNLILSGKITINNDAQALLFEKKEHSALSQIKRKLEEDILEILSFFSFNEIKDEHFRNELNCYKNLINGKILIYRGNLETGLNLIEKASIISGKFEFHNVKLACDEIIRSFRCSKTFGSNTNLYSDVVSNSLEMVQNILQAKAMNYPFISSGSFYDTPLLVKTDIDKIQKASRKSVCKKAMNWYSMAIIHYHLNAGENEKAKTAALNLLNDLKEKNDCVAGFEAREFYMQFARILIVLKQYEKAVWIAEQGMQNLSANGAEDIKFQEVTFLAYFRARLLHKAEEFCNWIENESRRKTESLPAIWQLYKSAVKFSLFKFKDSNAQLLCKEDACNNKALKLSMKLLELMNILELKDYDWFEYKIENFRKLLERAGVEQFPRLKFILKILFCLRKCDFKYKDCLTTQQSTLNKLQSKDQSLQWNPIGFEIIDFVDWLSQKSYNEKLHRNKIIADQNILQL